MGKITVHTIRTIHTKDNDYFETKEPLVNFVQKDSVALNHLSLNDICNLIGRNRNENDTIYWVEDNREYLEKLYAQYNRQNNQSMIFYNKDYKRRIIVRIPKRL